MRGLLRALAALGAAALAMGQTPAPNWNTQYAQTDGGHRVGNPAAKVKLTAFESYTCPHCGHFEQEAEGTLRIAYIHSGEMSLEVRHIIRDPIDLTVAMLTNCGDPNKFFDNHRAFMLGQNFWMTKWQRATQATIARWNTGEGMARRRALAEDLGFYSVMANRGYDRPQVDRCLNDETMARKLAEQSSADGKKFGVDSTPSFAINGKVLVGTHTWDDLRPKIDAGL